MIDTLNSNQLDSLYNLLSEIAKNTNPSVDVAPYYGIAEGKVAVWAFVVGIMALVISVFALVFEVKAARYLKRANRRRPSILQILEKLYDNYIRLHIIYEYDSEYDLSYLSELSLPDEEKSSNKKKFKTGLYQSEYILRQMLLPEDLIILSKYEIFEDEHIYSMAYSIKNKIIEYNRSLDIAADHIGKSADDSSLKVDRSNLLPLSRSLIKELMNLDKLMNRHKSLVSSKTVDVEEEMSCYILSRFFFHLSLITEDSVISDPYFVTDIAPIHITRPISIPRLRFNLVQEALNNNRHESKYFRGALNCIEKISRRMKDDPCDGLCVSLPESFVYIALPGYVNMTSVRRANNFDDRSLRENIEYNLGPIYSKICSQIDKGEFDVNVIAQYDMRQQIAIWKNDMLISGEVSTYNGEVRRVRKKRMWNDKKRDSLNK